MCCITQKFEQSHLRLCGRAGVASDGNCDVNARLGLWCRDEEGWATRDFNLFGLPNDRTWDYNFGTKPGLGNDRFDPGHSGGTHVDVSCPTSDDTGDGRRWTGGAIGIFVRGDPPDGWTGAARAAEASNAEEVGDEQQLARAIFKASEADRCQDSWYSMTDADRRSGVNDVMDVLAAYGMRMCGLVTDTNADCSINVQDLRKALSSFGCKCPVGRVIRGGLCEPCGPFDDGQCCAAGVVDCAGTIETEWATSCERGYYLLGEGEQPPDSDVPGGSPGDHCVSCTIAGPSDFDTGCCVSSRTVYDFEADTRGEFTYALPDGAHWGNAHLEVKVWGAGGHYHYGNPQPNTWGGGGAYAHGWILQDDLAGASELTVVVGASGCKDLGCHSTGAHGPSRNSNGGGHSGIFLPMPPKPPYFIETLSQISNCNDVEHSGLYNVNSRATYCDTDTGGGGFELFLYTDDMSIPGPLTQFNGDFDPAGRQGSATMNLEDIVLRMGAEEVEIVIAWGHLAEGYTTLDTYDGAIKFKLPSTFWRIPDLSGGRNCGADNSQYGEVDVSCVSGDCQNFVGQFYTGPNSFGACAGQGYGLVRRGPQPEEGDESEDEEVVNCDWLANEDCEADEDCDGEVTAIYVSLTGNEDCMGMYRHGIFDGFKPRQLTMWVRRGLTNCQHDDSACPAEAERCIPASMSNPNPDPPCTSAEDDPADCCCEAQNTCQPAADPPEAQPNSQNQSEWYSLMQERTLLVAGGGGGAGPNGAGGAAGTQVGYNGGERSWRSTSPGGLQSQSGGGGSQEQGGRPGSGDTSYGRSSLGGGGPLQAGDWEGMMSLGSGPFDVGFDSFTPGGGGGGYFGGGGGTIAAGDSRDGSSGGGGGSSFISSRVSHGGMETGTGYMPGGITVADRGGGQVGFGRSYRCILCQEYPDFMKTICNDEYSELVQAQTGTECEVNSGNPIERPDFTSGHGRVVIDLVCQVRRRPSDQNTRSRSPVYRWNPSGVVTRRVEMTSDALQISSTVRQHMIMLLNTIPIPSQST